MQLLLPIQIDIRPKAERILGQPIIGRSLFQPGNIPIEIVGGALAGESYIYLIHFQTKIAHSQHYVGSSDDLARRLKQHQRKYPLFRFCQGALSKAAETLPVEMYEKLLKLAGKRYRRHTTIEKAVVKIIGETAWNAYKFKILNAAKKHQGSPGLLMAANQRHIDWRCVKIWQADRELEFKLKRQKRTLDFCPLCQGTEVPF
jgi:hypothetical protein